MSTTDPTDLPFRVLRIIDLIPEPYCDRVGRDYMDEVDARSLALRLGILMVPVKESHDAGYLMTILGQATLFYRASLKGDVLAHVLLELIAQHLEGPGCSPQVSAAFAFVGRLGMDCRTRGAKWVARRWTQLREIDPDWYEGIAAEMETIMDAVRVCLIELNDVHPCQSQHLDAWTPSRAALQGRVARRRGALIRSEGWCQLALAMGTEGDPIAAAEALSCLARVEYQRGRVGAARAAWERMAEHADRHKLVTLAGTAHVNLAGVAMLSHDEEALRGHVRAASHRLPKGREELAALAQNYARYRMQRGAYAAAQPVLAALARLPSLIPQVRTAVYAGMARSCAGLGDRPGFEEAWFATLTMIDLAEEWSPDAYHDLALAAILLGEWGWADHAARRARAEAADRGDHRATFDADELLVRIARKEGAVFSHPTLEPVPWVPDGDVSLHLAEALTV